MLSGPRGRWPDPNHNLVWCSTRPSANTFRHRAVMQWQLSGQIGVSTGGYHQPEVGCGCAALSKAGAREANRRSGSLRIPPADARMIGEGSNSGS